MQKTKETEELLKVLEGENIEAEKVRDLVMIDEEETKKKAEVAENIQL